MGLMNDHGNQVQLLVDEEVLSAEYVGCHPCVNTSSMRLRTRDVFDIFLPAVHHTYQSVVLKGED
jgi:Ala-tRNA(Pro) deacylase